MIVDQARASSGNRAGGRVCVHVYSERMKAADGMGKSSGSKRNGSRNAIAFRWMDGVRHLP